MNFKDDDLRACLCGVKIKDACRLSSGLFVTSEDFRESSASLLLPDNVSSHTCEVVEQVYAARRVNSLCNRRGLSPEGMIPVLSPFSRRAASR
jgi:hypothetical protein